MRNQKIDNSVLHKMLREVRQLRSDVNNLKNAQVTTLPIYDDATQFDTTQVDAVEGQVVVDSAGNQLQFFQNGQWWSVGCFKVEDLSASWYESTDGFVVPNNLGGVPPDNFLPFTVKVNDFFNRWDNSTPTHLVCKEEGLYAVNAQVYCGGTSVNPNTFNNRTGAIWRITSGVNGIATGMLITGSPTTVQNGGGSVLGTIGKYFQFIDWFHVGDYFYVDINMFYNLNLPVVCDVKLRKLFA